MGLLSNIFGNQSKKKFIKDYAIYDKQYRYITTALMVSISRRLKKEMKIDDDKIATLSAQIVNYCMGEDINQSINNISNEPLKSNVLSIKHLIVPKAQEILDTDYKIRELIVYTHRMQSVYSFMFEGEKYLKSPEKQRRDEILQKYGEEFPYEASVDLYNKIFNEFYEATKSFF